MGAEEVAEESASELAADWELVAGPDVNSELVSEELGTDTALSTAELGTWPANDKLATEELTGGSELVGIALEGLADVGLA